MKSSFLLPLIIMAVAWIGIFVVCLIWFWIMKPYKKENKGKADSQKLKEVVDRQNSANNSKLSPSMLSYYKEL